MELSGQTDRKQSGWKKGCLPTLCNCKDYIRHVRMILYGQGLWPLTWQTVHPSGWAPHDRQTQTFLKKQKYGHEYQSGARSQDERTDRPPARLPACLPALLIVWLPPWLTDWLTARMTAWPPSVWLTHLLTAQMTDWLIDELTDWLTD